jgi:hypothetical protein
VKVANALHATGLAAAGYEYLNIDDCWSWNRDGAGRLVQGSVALYCRFAPPRVHFIPDLLRESAPLFLKRQCDRTLGSCPTPTASPRA